MVEQDFRRPVYLKLSLLFRMSNNRPILFISECQGQSVKHAKNSHPSPALFYSSYPNFVHNGRSLENRSQASIIREANSWYGAAKFPLSVYHQNAGDLPALIYRFQRSQNSDKLVVIGWPLIRKIHDKFFPPGIKRPANTSPSNMHLIATEQGSILWNYQSRTVN